MLSNLGYDIDVVENGQEAIDVLRMKSYPLVFMDMQMPVMGGVETTERIRSGTSGVLDPEIPIVAMTAHALAEAKAECVEAGMNDYISKPIKLASLRRVLDAYMGTHQDMEP